MVGRSERWARIRAEGKHKRLERGGKLKGSAWRRVAMPYVMAVRSLHKGVVEATEEKVSFKGLDQSHVTMYEIKIPNRVGIPPGEYGVEDIRPAYRGKYLRVGHLKNPTKVEYDPADHILKVGNKDYADRVKLSTKAVDVKLPRFSTNAKAKVDLDKLRKIAREAQKHNSNLVLVTWMGRLYAGFKARYSGGDEVVETDWNNGGKLVVHEDQLKVDLGPVKDGGEVTVATFDPDILEANLEKLVRSGAQEAELGLSTDMPLKLEANTPEMEVTYFQAHMIGV